jgi:CheY-like chemotaxis protein
MMMPEVLSPTLFTQAHPVSSLQRAAPLTVIVADDVTEIVVLLQTWLSEVGWSVMCASTGVEVLKLARKQHVDLIITDVLMPDGDGLDVIQDLKRSQPATRVLAISGGGKYLQASECLKFAKGMGAHDVLLKPFNREQLLAAVSRVIQGGT